MHRRNRSCAAVVIISANLFAACAQEPSTPMAPAAQAPFILPSALRPNGRYLVRFRDPLAPGARTQEQLTPGSRVTRQHAGLGLLTVEGLTASDARALAARPEIADVVPDATVQWIPAPGSVRAQQLSLATGYHRPPGTDQSAAFYFPIQWNMRQIRADRAWARTQGGRGRLVCILDTGIDPNHIDLAGKVASGLAVSFATDPTFPGNADPLDYNGHGTGIASYISSNGLGMASVAPDASLCSAKVLGVDGLGSFGDIITGILWADEVADADVINLSLGAYIDLRDPANVQLAEILQLVVDYVTRHGSVVVAAAGNDAINLDTDPRAFLVVPAQLQNVVSVGATGPVDQADFDRLASYSNFGGRTGIDLVAPGGDFVGITPIDLVLAACSQYQVTLPFTCTGTDYVLAAGTSEAAPHVAGALAVIGSARQWHRRPQALTRCLEVGADRVGPHRVFGAGRLNVLDAAQCDDDHRR
jgi:subtilisin family serine protease